MPAISHQSALSAYRSRIAEASPLSSEAEQRLALDWRAGNRAAGGRLVEACLPFVVGIALEYRRWGLPLEDIVQEGNLGLLKAVRRFDPARGCRLATYAGYWIRAEIREFVVRSYRIVRLGSSKSERRALRIYRRTREADPAALAAESGLSEERATALLPLLLARDVSLDRENRAGVPPSERLASAALSPEEDACLADEKAHLARRLATILAELPPRERRIARHRWMSDKPATLEQLGASFGVSKERVRQIEERAKRRVRERLGELSREPLAESA